MSKSYELWLYWKQGDAFRDHLEAANNDVPKALASWAESFKHNAAVCERLSKAFTNQDITGYGDTHHISFEPGNDKARECLEVMASEQLLSVNDWDDEEDEFDEEDDDLGEDEYEREDDLIEDTK